MYNIILLAVSLGLVAYGATIATRYAGLLAESFNFSKYVVGFIIVAIISILPETFVAINAAIQGVPALGLGTLLGSNVADLTLIFAAMIFIAGRDIKVERKILKHLEVYPFILFLPLILGLDGFFSRVEGAALIVAGLLFYFMLFQYGSAAKEVGNKNMNGKFKHGALLAFGMVLLIVGSYVTVEAASTLAYSWGITPILIGMLIVGLGTTIPELFFSLKAVQHKDDSLAIGDVLGTVLADATIVVGILALITPFSFPQEIIYITGAFMACAALILFNFMRSEKTLTRREGLILTVLWIAFAIVQITNGV